MSTTEIMARRFSEILHAWLGSEKILEIHRRNRTPEYAGCCASHDFCDANLAMAAAFKFATGREPLLPADEPDADAVQGRL